MVKQSTRRGEGQKSFLLVVLKRPSNVIKDGKGVGMSVVFSKKIE